ncbi:ABC transporter permease [Marinobacter lacisalsi]|uniref:ABC transporter permease n=1 Tax=Marinobacter lacisalsi TaxID=475979 RepID=A0ABV8QN56_9GAMM
MQQLSNIFHLTIKEWRSLGRDRIMVALILFAFSINIYISSASIPETLHMAPIAIVDEDRSPLSVRMTGAFYPPWFIAPTRIEQHRIDPLMDAGDYTFVLDIPPGMQRDLLAGNQPTLQLNVDATKLNQAFLGAGYIQAILTEETRAFVQGDRRATSPVELEIRNRFNPALSQNWFGAVIELIDNITMLSIILTGAALIREREHGTIEHLLVMPLRPVEIMVAKVVAMGLVVLLASSASLALVVQGWMRVPIEGSTLLFLVGTALHLFATTSMGIFLATVARSMPQLGMLIILVLIPLQLLSGGATPFENMPYFVQTIMQVAPTTHFIGLAQAILFRGAGLAIVWPSLLALAVIGGAFFVLSLRRFRKSVAGMA